MAPRQQRQPLTYEQLQEILQNNPHARRMLDAIAMSEGTFGKGQQGGYDILFGGQTIPSLAAHPNIRKAFNNPDGGPNYTTAAGRYQFTGGTYNDMAKRLGRPLTFSADDQDIAALALMDTDGALDSVLAGNYGAAAARLGNRWVNLPSATSKQRKWNWADFDKALQRAGGSEAYPRPTADAAPAAGTVAPQAALTPRLPALPGGLSFSDLPITNLPGPFEIPKVANALGADLFDLLHPQATIAAALPPAAYTPGQVHAEWQARMGSPADAALAQVLGAPSGALPVGVPGLVDWDEQRQQLQPEASWTRRYLDQPIPRTLQDRIDLNSSETAPSFLAQLGDPGPLAAALRALALEQSLQSPATEAAPNLFMGGLSGGLAGDVLEPAAPLPVPETTFLPAPGTGAPSGGNPFLQLPNTVGWGGQVPNRLAGDPWLFPAARAGVAPVIDLTPTFSRQNVGPRDARGMNDRLFGIAQQMNAADNLYRNTAGQSFDPHPTYWDDRFRQLLDLSPEELQRLSDMRRMTTTRMLDDRT